MWYKIVFIEHNAPWLAVWHGSLVTPDLWQTASSQHWQTACSPVTPLLDDICESQQHCQHPSTQQIVNVISAVRLSLYLSLIQAHTALQTVSWQKPTVGSWVDQRSDESWSASELSTGWSFRGYSPLHWSCTKQLGLVCFLMGHHPLVFGMQVSNLSWSLCSPCLATVEAPHWSGKQRWHSSSFP